MSGFAIIILQWYTENYLQWKSVTRSHAWSSIYSHDFGSPLHSQRSTCLGNTRQNDIDIRWSKYIHTNESRVLQLNYTPVRCTYLLPHTIHHRRHGWHSTYFCLIEKKYFSQCPLSWLLSRMCYQDHHHHQHQHLLQHQLHQLPEFPIHSKTLQPSSLSVLKCTLTKVSLIFMMQSGSLSLVQIFVA